MAGDRTRVGNVEILACNDGMLELPVQMVFPTLAAGAMTPFNQRYPQTVSPQGNILDPMGFYVLRSQGKTVLVDTGIGPGPIEAFGGVRGNLPQELRRQGVKAEEIDVVLLTHLHPDHVGWNLTAQGRPTFPRARYLVHRADWEFFTNRDNWKLLPYPYVESCVLPLQRLGVLDLVTGERAVTGEVTTLPTPGHTPGHMSVLIASAGQRAIVTGDVSVHVAQVTETDWNTAFDGIPEMASETRRQLLDRIEREGMIMIAGHFPVPGIGKLVRLQGKRYWQAL